MGVLKDFGETKQGDTVSIRVRYIDVSSGDIKVEFWQCMSVAYERYEYLKTIHDYVELGVMINDYHFWLLKWGEHDLQD